METVAFKTFILCFCIYIVFGGYYGRALIYKEGISGNKALLIALTWPVHLGRRVWKNLKAK